MFSNIIARHDWQQAQDSIYSKTGTDVLLALRKSKRTIEDFKALLSPAALPFLEQMAQLSHRLTQKRFGKTMRLYMPLYLSNECQNICTYCGFSLDNKIKRRTLSAFEILQEGDFIRRQGIQQVLLVTGEANQTAGTDYLCNAIRLLRKQFANITIEVQPLDESDYRILIGEGLDAVLVYQETYHRERYKKYHPKGKKSNFGYRLETPDRLGRAGIHKIGLGTLIGLEDWRTDNFFTALHVQYLERTYWRTRYSISFPRLRPAAGHEIPNVTISDKELVQLICAWRIYNEEIELSLSTREHAYFRDHAIRLGITSMSAGSATNPGGYVVAPDALEQFETDDKRTVAAVAKMLAESGYTAVWKDRDTFANYQTTI